MTKSTVAFLNFILWYAMFVCLFRFLSETTDPIGLKYFMGLHNDKAKRQRYLIKTVSVAGTIMQVLA